MWQDLAYNTSVPLHEPFIHLMKWKYSFDSNFYKVANLETTVQVSVILAVQSYYTTKTF